MCLFLLSEEDQIEAMESDGSRNIVIPIDEGSEMIMQDYTAQIEEHEKTILALKTNENSLQLEIERLKMIEKEWRESEQNIQDYVDKCSENNKLSRENRRLKRELSNSLMLVDRLEKEVKEKS